MRAVTRGNNGVGIQRTFVGANKDAIATKPQIVAFDEVFVGVVVDTDGLRVVGLPASERLIEGSFAGRTPDRAILSEDVAGRVPEVQTPVSVVGEIAVLNDVGFGANNVDPIPLVLCPTLRKEAVPTVPQ